MSRLLFANWWQNIKMHAYQMLREVLISWINTCMCIMQCITVIITRTAHGTGWPMPPSLWVQVLCLWVRASVNVESVTLEFTIPESVSPWVQVRDDTNCSGWLPEQWGQSNIVISQHSLLWQTRGKIINVSQTNIVLSLPAQFDHLYQL